MRRRSVLASGLDLGHEAAMILRWKFQTIAAAVLAGSGLVAGCAGPTGSEVKELPAPRNSRVQKPRPPILLPQQGPNQQGAPQTQPQLQSQVQPENSAAQGGVARAQGAFIAPKLMVLDGVEGLIGANAAQLIRQFGRPRLDVTEGDARKLQFTGPACVLDVYLYPFAQGGEPKAAYIDTRRASDGYDVDRIACVKALLKP